MNHGGIQIWSHPQSLCSHQSIYVVLASVLFESSFSPLPPSPSLFSPLLSFKSLPIPPASVFFPCQLLVEGCLEYWIPLRTDLNHPMQGVYSCNRNMWEQAPGEAGLRATHCKRFLGEPDLGDRPTSQALCVLRTAGVWGKPAFQWRVILNLSDVFQDVVSVFQISCKRGLSHSGWVGPPLLLHPTCLLLPTDYAGVGGCGCCLGQAIGWGKSSGGLGVPN